MKIKDKFQPEDVIRYYDDTEVHYRMFWKFEESMGLHYGVWDKGIRRLSDAIIQNNAELARLGSISAGDYVLDAGCGIGGSSIYLAKTFGCRVTGITLSEKQVATATRNAEKHGVAHLVNFLPMNYTATTFADNTFDAVWAIESMETAPDKLLFLQEVRRVLKPDGRLLVADVFKSHAYDVNTQPDVKIMLNGWAISDAEFDRDFIAKAQSLGFTEGPSRDVTREVGPTVFRIFILGILGFCGTVLYNVFVKRSSYFNLIHYKTCFGQYKSYHKQLWTYKLLTLSVGKKEQSTGK